jgi:ATP-dependent DNA helicase RecQ
VPEPRPAAPGFDAERWAKVDEAAERLGPGALSSAQRRAIRAALEGRDVLLSLGAGAGKTTVAGVLAQLVPGPTVIISPRPKLLREQYDRWLCRRLDIVRIDSASSESERRSALARLCGPTPPTLLCTTSALSQPDVISALQSAGVRLVVLEDAHSLSEWSDEISPSAWLIPSLLTRLGRPAVLALVGPASAAVRHDIAQLLALQNPAVIEEPPLGDHVIVECYAASGDARQRALAQLVLRLRRPGLVFARTPREVDAIHASLTALRIPVHRYHEQLTPGARAAEFMNFMLPGRRTIMVATSAFAPHSGLAGLGEGEPDAVDRSPVSFGLGLDKRDLRFVIHWSSPTTLEQYAREVGCVGRDGESAHAILFFDPGDESASAAELARLRVEPAHLFKLSRALETRQLEGGSCPVEELALASGLSHSTTQQCVNILADAGLCAQVRGWVSPALSGALLGEQTRRLAARLSTLVQQDVERLRAVSRFVTARECRRALLARHFGAPRVSPCGTCPACGGESLVTGQEAAPARRQPVTTFSVSRVDGAPPSEPRTLTAKLGDFSRFAAR